MSVKVLSSRAQARHAQRIWLLGYAFAVGAGLLIAMFARRRLTEPYLGLTLALILLLTIAWLIRPRSALYTTLFLTAVSDINTVWWFPFVKNLSSRESIAYVADALTVSPLEISLYVGLTTSVLRHYAGHQVPTRMTPLTVPLLAFTTFVAYAFVRGVMVGGDLRIAVLEARSLLYIALVFVVVTNECTRPEHLRRALWAMIAGVVVQSLLSIEYLLRLDPAVRDVLERLTEHGSALGQNLLFVGLVVLLLFRIGAPWIKLVLAVSAMPVVYVYFIAERRAGVAALAVAGALVAVVLFHKQRAVFWAAVPIMAVVLVAYLGAFWTTSSRLGFPAQAIKSVIAPGAATAEDRQSDLYRLAEAKNLSFTIRTDPVRGLGFGRPFYQPVRLPKITSFPLSAYTPHNSILWIWIKTGFLGFVSLFYLFANSIVLGARRIRHAALDIDFVVPMVSTLFVVMYAAYTWVDISWDARNCVFLGFALAAIAHPSGDVARGSAFDDDRRRDGRARSTTPARVSA